MTTVLVVDDDVRILRMVSTFLRADGYDVLTAEDGLSALQALKDAEAELVLLDLNLPDIQGDEVLRRARNTGYQGPIVLISADLEAPQIAAGLDAYYLAKPFDPADLFAMIETLTQPLQARAS